MSRKRRPSGRFSRSHFTTKSGKTIKVNRNLMARWVSWRDDIGRRKAERRASLPKGRIKRFFYHFKPKRMYEYWFSREGGIMALKILGISIAAMFVIIVGLFAYFRKDLPNLRDISGSNLGGSISYYDKTGETLLWQDYDAVKRLPVKDEDISNFVKQATVATEDKDFFKHGGFDVRGILRAGLNDVFGSGGRQGGSTITQQLVKLSQNWTDQRTITRKVKELILSVELERSYSKQEILTGYLNIAPYGNIEYGVEAAANDYFNKSAKDLNLQESAFLAAIPKSPSLYSPYGPVFDQEALIGRQHYVLDQMASENMITKEQAEEAKKVDILATVKPQQAKYAGIKSPYFVLAAKKELENKYGPETVNRGGWKVTTTMDAGLQAKAEELVAENLKSITRYGANEEALVTQDVQTGQIVALVGGTDFNNPDHGQNNFGAGILLPPGSSFKPYDYTAFIENNNNVGAGSVLYDTEGPLPGYPCTNKALPKNGGNCLKDYDFKAPGPMTLRYALGGSRNIPAVKAMLSTVPNDNSNGRTASINKTISIASSMMANPYVEGNTYNCYSDQALTKTTQCYGASAIGDGAFLRLDDHANGLATLGRMGKAIPKTYILKITDAANKSVYEYEQPKGNQVIKPDTAYIVNDMAADPKASYLPGSCSETNCTPLSSGGFKFHRYNGWKFAIKTGTTNDGYDGLMTAWSSKYSVVSWVGHHTRRVTLRTSMERLTEPLTRGMMEAAHANQQPSNWVQPAGIKTLPAFIVRTHVGLGSIEPSTATDLFPSWYQGDAGGSTTAAIDKVSGRLATNCTPNLAKDTGANSNAAKWNVDVFVGGVASSGASSASAGNDDVHVCGEAQPSITITPNNGNNVCVVNAPCNFTVNVAAGAHPLSSDKFKGTVNLQAGGQTIAAITIDNPGSYLVGFTPTQSGTSHITAQVIDSVLYDVTTPITVITINDAAAPGPVP